MRKIVLLISFILSGWTAPTLSMAQTAELTGLVFLPEAKKQAPVSRGRAYRGRGRAASQGNSGGGESATTDVIISAHPVSFDAEVKPLPESVQILQTDAQFIPHVTPLTPGTTIQFINEDEFYHNVFSLTPGEKFNIGRKPKGDISEQKIEKLGEIKLFCDIHTHMNAIVLSLDTPYFTRTNEDGSYTLPNLPPGTYEIRVYHPNFSQHTEKITLKADEKAKKDFAMSG